MYTDRVERPRRSGRATRSRTSGTCSRRSACRRPTGRPTPVEMPETPTPRAARRARLRDAGRARRRRARRAARQRRQPVPPLAGGLVRGARRAARRRGPVAARRRDVGPLRIRRGGRASAAPRARASARGPRRVLRCGEFDLAGAARAGRARRPLRRRRQRPAARRGHAPTTPIVGLYGPTLAARSEPWRDPGLVTESVEPGPLRVPPVRPARVRQPGDFRCLSGTPAARVAEAAERALAREARRRGRAIEPLLGASGTLTCPPSRSPPAPRPGTGSSSPGSPACSAFVGALQVSIAAAGILLAFTLACWAPVRRGAPRARSRSRGCSGRCSPTPALTLLSAASSPDPRTSFID